MVRASNRIADLLGAAIGGSIGFMTHGPIGVVTGQIAGAAVTHGLRRMADASVTRKLVRELPALGEEMRRWQKALDRMNSGPNRLAAASASAQLARSLNPFGIKLPIFAAETGPSPAEEKKDKSDVQRPGTEKAHGGAVNKDQYFTNRAHGGRVSDSRRVAIR